MIRAVAQVGRCVDFKGCSGQEGRKSVAVSRCYNRNVVRPGKKAAFVWLLTAIVFFTSASVAWPAPLPAGSNHPNLSADHSAFVGTTAAKVEKSSPSRVSAKKRSTPALVVIADFRVAWPSTSSLKEPHPTAVRHRQYHTARNRAPPQAHLS